MYNHRIKLTPDFSVTINSTFGEGDEQYFEYSLYDKEGNKQLTSYDSVESNMIDFLDPAQEEETYISYIKDNMTRIQKKHMLSDCSVLMKYLYAGVACSESGYYKMSTDCWQEMLKNEEFSEKNLEEFKEEVKRLALTNAIWFDEPGTVAATYSELLCCFNSLNSGCEI